MCDRRSLLGALIGLMLCISLWRMSIIEPPMITELPYLAAPLVTIYNINDTTFPPPVTLEHLLKNDFNNLIDLDDFDFIINHKSCNEMNINPIVLILVHSAPNNWHKRNIIRDTWGREDSRGRLIFLLGAVNQTKTQRQVEQENHLYGDIVQGNFMDAYKNMTYKHVMALKWFTYYCPKAKYILKTDDDVFVNSPAVYDYLDNTIDKKKWILCWKVIGARVKRSYRSKWHVSTKEYTGRYYPPYCPGYSIIYSPDTAFQLYREAQKTPYFWIDDVHITGTIAQKINVTITSIGNLFLKRTEKANVISGKQNTSGLNFFFTNPDLPEDEIKSLWKAVLISKNQYYYNYNNYDHNTDR